MREEADLQDVYHITVGYVFDSSWEKTPRKGQRWIAYDFQSPTLITQKLNLSPLHDQDSHWRFWYIWGHHKVLWATEKSEAGTYVTNFDNLSSKAIPEHSILRRLEWAGHGYSQCESTATAQDRLETAF